MVLELDGTEAPGALAEPRERRAELQGGLSPTPTELGLKAGDHVKLAIAAWDNDDVSGHKVGRSREIEVVVLGANGLDARAEDRHRELRKLLLHTLADFLEEPWPPGRTGGAVAAWGEVVSKRYGPVNDWFETTWGDRKPRSDRKDGDAPSAPKSSLGSYTEDRKIVKWSTGKTSSAPAAEPKTGAEKAAAAAAKKAKK